jgi:Flp pilus assembly protein TadG
MKKWLALKANCRGTTAIELAIALPVLLLFIFGIIEAARALWTMQVLQETAYVTARCLAVGDQDCDTTAEAKAYAIARAAQSTISLPASAVTISSSSTCDGIDEMAQVSLSLPYASAVGGFVPAMPSSLDTSACMPLMTEP